MRALSPSVVVAVASIAACGGGSAPNAVVTVSPPTGLWDRARTIVVARLNPGQRVTLHARTSLPSGIWASSATFKASSRGTVDLATEAPLRGSYSGVSAMGLLWSEKLLTSQRGPLNGLATTKISADAGGQTVGSASLTQSLNGPGVRMHQETVASAGFYGQYFSPAPGVSHAPALVLWGGSEGDLGGAPEAALLASHGIPTLALAYFDDPGLPCRLEDIPLEYFVKAINWLRRQRQVDPRKMWIDGASRGAEAALLVASHFPAQVHGVVAIAPTYYVFGANPGHCQISGPKTPPPAWTLHGKPVAPRGVIPVRQITADLLLIAGGDDTVWPSFVYAPQIMAHLPHNGAPHRYLYYPQAGHIVLGIPYSVVPNEFLDDGGTTASDSAAWMRAWPAMIDFINSH